MYGVEWQQPAIVAMGLAQAAVHQDNVRGFLLAAEEAAAKVKESAAAAAASSPSMPSIASLYRDVAADEKLATAAQLSDGNKIRDGILARASDEMIRVAAKVNVAPEDLGRRTVEMYNTAVYVTAAAALRPGKEPRFDFFLMLVLLFYSYCSLR